MLGGFPIHEALKQMKHNSKWPDGERPEGRYANYFEIGHNPFEFILDFGQFHGGDRNAVFHTRIITGPAYAKALFHTLGSAIEEFEKGCGVIRDDQEHDGVNENGVE